MKVAIFEVCRRPEILKSNTEAVVLSERFANLGSDFDIYANDAIWTDRPKAGTIVDRDVIRERLRHPSIVVVHFAVHGGPAGLLLSRS